MGSNVAVAEPGVFVGAREGEGVAVGVEVAVTSGESVALGVIVSIDAGNVGASSGARA